MKSRLSTYRAKRHFNVTPEPSPESKPKRRKAAAKPTYMIHKHDATRLHYDLRLEEGGVLVSWAIPKGPSFDPADRRLAVQTEDHPLAYGEFEGRIPDGEYGAGDSLIWDRGTYETVPPGQFKAMHEKGHLVVEFDGEKLKGRFHLVRTRPNLAREARGPSAGSGRPAGGKQQWLFFKGKDEHARTGYDLTAERPESVASGRRVTRGPVRAAAKKGKHPQPLDLLLKIWPPMLATLSTPKSASERTHVLEVKYDGYRAIAGVSGGRVALQSRNGKDLAARFPQVVRGLSKLPMGEVVLDGEVVALDAKGAGKFELIADPRAPHKYYVFDILWLDGEDLRERPLEERRELLESVLAHAPEPLELSQRIETTIAEGLAEARASGSEGLVAKRLGSTYAGGRTKDWLKLKVSAGQEFAIVGWLPLTNADDQVGALLVAVHEGKGRYRFAGKVGTGYTNALRRQLAVLLSKDAADEPTALGAPRYRNANWSAPRYVAEIAFTEWTRDGKLRHPSFRGLRMDKRPEQCVRESAAAVGDGKDADDSEADARV